MGRRGMQKGLWREETTRWGVGYNSKIYLREIEWGGEDWIHMAQDKDQWWVLVNMVLNLWVP
jgi:hypothetical protein